MKKLLSAFVSKRTKPCNIIKKDTHLFEYEYSKEFSESYFYTFDDVVIKYPLMYSHKKYLNTYLNHVYPNIRRFKLFLARYLIVLKKLGAKKVVLQGRYIWVTDTLSSAYFHWFGDVLPKLVALKENKLITAKEKVLLPNRLSKYDYVRGSLNLLNIEYICFEENNSVFIKELLFVPNLIPTGNFHDQCMLDLRRKFIKSLPLIEEGFGERIYISRKKATRRKIFNESILEDILVKNNFKIYYFEDIPWLEQINIMRNAKYLISLHGAGLTNMLFMKDESKILEIRAENDISNNCFFSLSSALKYKYYYCLGKNESNDFHKGNLVIDKDVFEQTIKMMI